MLCYNADDTMTIIYDIDYSRITMNDFIKYIAKKAREQKYNDYNGVGIIQIVVTKLKAIVKH